MCVSPCSATDLDSQTSRYSVVSEMEDTAPRFNVSQSTGYSNESTFTEPWSSQAISISSSPPKTSNQATVYPSHQEKNIPYLGVEELSSEKSRLSDSELCSSPSSYLPDTTPDDLDVFSSAGGWSGSTFADSVLTEQSQTTSRAYTKYTSQSASGQNTTVPASAQYSDKEVVPEEAYRPCEQSSTKAQDPHSLLCRCHNRPILPTLFWPHPQHILDVTAGQNDALRSTNKTRLHTNMKDIFEFIVKLSFERIESLEYDMRQSIAPAFQQRPTLESSLAALCALVGGAEPFAIGELVSLLYFAFTVLMLSVDELDRDRYTEACSLTPHPGLRPSDLIMTSVLLRRCSMLSGCLQRWQTSEAENVTGQSQLSNQLVHRRDLLRQLMKPSLKTFCTTRRPMLMACVLVLWLRCAKGLLIV